MAYTDDEGAIVSFPAVEVTVNCLPPVADAGPDTSVAEGSSVPLDGSGSSDPDGTVTRGWEQMHTNRQSSYAKLKDVKLEVRDARVQMLGRDGAVVAFLWTQSQTYDGTPDTATGRTTLVFRRIGKQWKAHISPDSPDQLRVPASERTTTPPATTPKPTP